MCCQNRPSNQGLLNGVLAALPRSRVSSAVRAPGVGWWAGGLRVCSPALLAVDLRHQSRRGLVHVCVECLVSCLSWTCCPGHLTHTLRASVSPTVRQRLEWHPGLTGCCEAVFTKPFSSSFQPNSLSQAFCTLFSLCLEPSFLPLLPGRCLLIFQGC